MNSILRSLSIACLTVVGLWSGLSLAEGRDASVAVTRRGGEVPMSKSSDNIDDALSDMASSKDGIPVRHTYEVKDEGGTKQVKQVKPVAARKAAHR